MVDVNQGRNIAVLAVVICCFAILWPKLFYPMITSSYSTNPQPADNLGGCCDVIFETDVTAIKIITELCGHIMYKQEEINPKVVKAFQEGKMTKEVVEICHKEVFNTCGIDITTFLNEKVRLGQTYKQILDEVRSFNNSVCLKLNFGIAPGMLGAPRLMKIGSLKIPRHHRQERPSRPSHSRPEMIHPALREKGRAIPQSHVVPRSVDPEAKPGPIPGLRPPLGGHGHVVAAPKGSGTIGIIMPMYTVGIVIFFMYTIMKVLFKKSGPSNESQDFSSDMEFRKYVFSTELSGNRSCEETNNKPKVKSDETSKKKQTDSKNGKKLVVSAISGLLAEVDRQREGLSMQAEEHDEGKDKETSQQNGKLPSHSTTSETKIQELSEHFSDSDTEAGTKVKVMGMELSTSCKGAPVLPQHPSRNLNPIPTPEPQSIFLEGHLPSQSQLLVSDSETETQEGDEPDAPVILSGKMTLSVISLDAALAEEDERLKAENKESSAITDEKRESEYEEDEEIYEDERGDEQHGLRSNIFSNMNDACEDGASNYSTANVADSNLTGPEETAAEISAMDSIEQDQDELEGEEEVWNGDIGSDEDEAHGNEPGQPHHY